MTRPRSLSSRAGTFALAFPHRTASPSPAISNAVRRTASAAALAAAAAALGGLIAAGYAAAALALAAIVLLIVVSLSAPGVILGVLLLAVLNGVPVANLAGRALGGVRIQDLAVLALGAFLLVYQGRPRNEAHARLIRLATIWAACFVGWWGLTLARSVLLYHIPLRDAALFGRDFLYFGLLLPLAVRARLPAGSLRAAVIVLLAGVILYSVGEILASVTGVTLSALVHPAQLTDLPGVTRVYSSMGTLVSTALIFAAALLFTTSGRRYRPYLIALVGLLILASVLRLTRANYAALGVAFLVGIWVYAIRYGSATVVAVRGLIVVIAAIALLAPLIHSTGVGTGGGVAHAVIARVEQGVNDLSNSTGTVGYRENLDRNMLAVLGHQWLIGLGFLHPGAHYVPSLPLGSIRNADTGVFNALMTMGVVGVILLFVPLLYGLREILRVSKTQWFGSQSSPRWLIYGSAAWIAWVMATSPTLGVLFGPTGLVMVALVLGTLSQIFAGFPAQRSRGAAQAPGPLPAGSLPAAGMPIVRG